MTRDLPDSCLLGRMSYYLDLADDDKQLLLDLEKDEVSFPARRYPHFNTDTVTDNLFIVKSGWLYSFVDIDDKHRQVLRIHYPGDIVGLTDVAMRQAYGKILTVTDTVLCPFPKNRLDEIFTQSPRLTALIFSLGMLDQIILLDRLKMMGRSQAVNRVIHFLLEIMSRLKIHTDKQNFNEFYMPLTQEVIGDAIGLTNVSVSNAITQLEYEGAIRVKKKMILIHNPNELKARIDFQDRYFKIDTSWFPGKTDTRAVDRPII